jgi:hypothetical protein
MNIISKRSVSQWDRSPNSGTIANLVMENIEEIALLNVFFGFFLTALLGTKYITLIT